MTGVIPLSLGGICTHCSPSTSVTASGIVTVIFKQSKQQEIKGTSGPKNDSSVCVCVPQKLFFKKNKNEAESLYI